MSRWRRALVIFGRLVPFVVAFLRDRRRWILFGRKRSVPAEVHRKRAKRLTSTIAKLGPTFIKLAQVFSARADILREPYLSAIGTLQDQVPPDPPESVRAMIESEIGRPVEEVFTDFEREPVAAASLGQVHRALYEGRTVAVKVLRGDVEELVATDLDISFRILFLLNILFPNHHVKALTNVVREFSVRVRIEMDFREEARHLQIFHRHFASDERVRAPAVYRDLTRRRVLVMEWIDGDKVDQLDPRFESGELQFDTLMETLTEVYLRMLLVDGFLHADPHPGNILVDPQGRIVFLDWGMALLLRPATRDRIIQLSLAAASEDVDSMINHMYALGMIDPDISRTQVRDAAAEILVILDQARDFGTRKVQEMVHEIMDTFYTWPLILPRELVYFFRAAALLEGIGFRYDPAFNGLDVARPVVRRMSGELLRVAGKEPVEVARGIFEDARGALNAVRDVVRRAEREEFRVRVHPRDFLQLERFLTLQARRVQLSIFALTISLIASITFLEFQNVWLLLVGLLIAVVMFVVVLLLPTHLLENPLRHARRLRLPEEAPRDGGEV